MNLIHFQFSIQHITLQGYTYIYCFKFASAEGNTDIQYDPKVIRYDAI